LAGVAFMAVTDVLLGFLWEFYWKLRATSVVSIWHQGFAICWGCDCGHSRLLIYELIGGGRLSSDILAKFV